MIIKWKQKKYCMTFGAGLRCRLMLTWYKRRRLFRFAKRIIRNSMRWSLPFLFLVLSTSLCFYALYCMNFIDKSSAIVQSISIVLSSFLLIFIKDTLDAENSRRKNLRMQYGIYNKYRYQFAQSFMSLCDALGIQRPAWSAFSNNGFLGEEIVILQTGDCNYPSNESIDAFDALERNLKEFQLEIISVDLVDYELRQDSRLVSDALALIRSARVSSDVKLVQGNARDLFCRLNQILASLRRPWKYKNDLDRDKLVEKYIHERGVESSS